MTDKRFMYELHSACFRDNGKAMITGEVVHTLNELHEENEHIKQTIKDMMENERTEIGKMTLRQLWRQIQ